MKKEVQDTVNAVKRHTKLFENESELLHHHITQMESRRRIMEWLSLTDFSQDLRRAQGKRTNGTCQWILTTQSYVDWKFQRIQDPLLWMCGKPGSGKTVLSAYIVQELQQSSPDICTAYFLFGAQHSPSDILEVASSLISQLVAHQSRVSSELLSAFETAARYGRGRISAADQPMTILLHLLRAEKLAYLVFDGIDESSDPDGIVREIVSLSQLTNVRIIISSRDTPDVRRHMSQRNTINLVPMIIDKDIEHYLRTELETIANSFDRSGLSTLVFSRLSSVADGSFLWAFLMLQTLRKAVSVDDFLSISEKLPKDLEAIYASYLQCLSEEPDSTKYLGRDILCWVCFTRRPLKWKELEHAISFNADCTKPSDARRPFKSTVIRLCNPVIEYDHVLDEFRPIHWSVCEFIAQKNDLNFYSHKRVPPGSTAGNANAIILRTCVQILNEDTEPNLVRIDAGTAALKRYATIHWSYHLLQATISQELRSAIESFIAVSSHRKTWVAQYMLLQMTASPLQSLLRQLREVHAWLVKKPNPSNVPTFDVLQDTLDITHFLAFQSASRISYFDIMLVVRDLARAYTQAGRLSDAVSWLEAALDDVAESGPQADSKRIWFLNSLGIMYDQQTKFDMAVTIQMRALALQQTRLDPDHLDIVWTKNELGRVYRHLWRLSDAEQMHLEALTTLEKQVPESDPHVVWTKNTLARTYRFLGRLDQSLKLHEEALTVQTATIGPNHCHTLWTLSDIARCFRDKKLFDLAYEKFLDVLKGRSDTLGELHPDTLWSLNDVGLVLAQLGEEQEAIRYHEKALNGQIERLGENHEQTKWTESVLKHAKMKAAELALDTVESPNPL
jgi:tetratricopeptide (TPR) repeat protein